MTEERCAERKIERRVSIIVQSRKLRLAMRRHSATGVNAEKAVWPCQGLIRR